MPPIADMSGAFQNLSERRRLPSCRGPLTTPPMPLRRALGLVAAEGNEHCLLRWNG